MIHFNTLAKAVVATVFALLAGASFAAVDVNKASQAELESVKSIGPAIAERIVDERQKATFKDWGDMIDRVKGVGPGNASKFSSQGLTVNGSAFSGAPAAAVTTPKKKAVEDTAAQAKKV
ncbi:MAG: hypothetical protein AD742_08440 [Methylibium sp. NZG]|nr:MAG: hypothetical protein AD742_08440 [Methylibium sp. NZG]